MELVGNFKGNNHSFYIALYYSYNKIYNAILKKYEYLRKFYKPIHNVYYLTLYRSMDIINAKHNSYKMR